MQVAFYAPLKDPNHPVPSGDRTMAQALIRALDIGGCTVDLTSDLRIYDKMGEPELQARLFEQAAAESARLISDPRAKGWRAWVTYHNYYKAPDLIGPVVSRVLGIPYLQIEATRARKRLAGPWARFAEAAEAACDTAATIFYLTERDAEALRRDAPEGQDIVHLRPFLARTDLPEAGRLDGPILSVGMMRPGDKLASYALIAQTLALLDGDWRLDIAGDGPARDEVARMMARFGDKVRFLGKLEADALAQAYRSAGMLFWPGVNEAFGLAYLEAQAAGLPVVAQNRPGVCDVLHSPMVPLDAGPAGMAERLRSLLADENLRTRESTQVRAAVRSHHLLPAAAKTLRDALERLT